MMWSLSLTLLIQASLWISVSPQKFLSRQATAVPTNTVPTSTIGPDLPTSRMMLNEMAETFLRQIFRKYGNDGVMTFEAFEHLLENLGLGNMEISDHDLQDHFSEKGFEEFHESHDHKASSETRGSHEDHEGDHNHTDHHGDHDHGDNDHGDHEDHHGDSEHEDHDHADHHGDSEHGDHDHADHHGDSEREDHDHADHHGDSEHGDCDHADHHGDSEHGDHNHADHHGDSEHGDHDHADHHGDSEHEDHDHADHHGDSEHGDSDHADHHGDSEHGDHDHADHHGDSEHGDHDHADHNGDSEHGDHDHADHHGEGDHGDHDHTHHSTIDHLHRRHSHNTTRSSSQNDSALDSDESQRLKRRVLTDELSIKKCLSASEILMTYHLQLEGGITMDDFVNLCPAIVFQIDEHMCNRGHMKSECDNHDHHHDHHDHDHHGNETMHHQKVEPLSHRPWWQFWKIPWKVWLAALCAVTIISLVGLFSVAMVPIMQKMFFNQLIQFLVALAIGSLTGDALLHLIPHAIAGGHGGHEEEGHEHGHEQAEESSHSHAEAVWKCMVALGGIYLFFVMERLMGMVTQWKRAKKKKREVAELLEMSTTSFNNVVVGEKLSKHNDKYASCGNFLFVHSSKDVCRLAEEAHEELEQIKECEEELKHLHANDLDHQSEGHGHSHDHGHGHSHDVPDSISSVAWMVIMGDGLHNFTDGLAIGAGFANSLSGGLSTSLAVFCHELPHELGDFAVLLRAGMSVKQALFYNIVSSVLCYLGMLIGVILGNLSQASLWIFAMTGGMFIYISLVDMMPELTSSRSGQLKQGWRNLLLQILGISVGVSIMLVIALYEDRIQVNIGD